MSQPLSRLWTEYLSRRTPSGEAALCAAYKWFAEQKLRTWFKGKLEYEAHHAASIEGMTGAAYTGLLIGVRTFDPDAGAKPETHLHRCIWREVVQDIRDRDPLTRRERGRVKAGLMEVPKAAEPMVPVSTLGWAEELAGSETGPEAGPEVAEVLLEVTGGMTERECLAFVLRHFEGFTLREVDAAVNRQPWPGRGYVSRETARIFADFHETSQNVSRGL